MVRYLRARTLGHATNAEALQVAALKKPADKASTDEQALADRYHAWDYPPHAVPWWLRAHAHADLLRQLRATAESLLLKP